VALRFGTKRRKPSIFAKIINYIEIKTFVVYKSYRGSAPYIKKQQLKRATGNRRRITKMKTMTLALLT
jgi:hypothetical protein